MAFSQVTLREVAQHAGVHPATASRAINAETRALVNVITAERVLTAAAELGYRPNPMARGLKTNRSETIGVLIPDLMNALFPPIVRGIEDRLSGEGYTIFLANSDNDQQKGRLQFEAMRARQVEGYILATAEQDDPLIPGALVTEIPIVMVNRTIKHEHAFTVVGRDRTGSSIAVDHLVELGHRRIAHVGGPRRFSTGLARYEGFIKAMLLHRLEPDEELIWFGKGFSERDGMLGFQTLLRSEKEFTAVVAGNDLLALGCYDAMAKENISCPREVSVVGYNDMPLMDKLCPPLTTIRIPHYEIGWKAADLLLERLHDMKAPPRTTFLEPELIVRSSTGPPQNC